MQSCAGSTVVLLPVAGCAFLVCWQFRKVAVARLSIVIPALGSAARLENSLVAVLEHRPADSEVVVVLGAPYDDPYDLKDEVRFVDALPRSSLLECLHVGLEASRGALVHVLASGWAPRAGWADAPLAHLHDPRLAAVAVAMVADDEGPHETARVLCAGVEYGLGGKRRLARQGESLAALGGGPQPTLGPCLQAAFYRRSALALLGEPFATHVGDDLADVDLALRLHGLGYRALLEPESVVAGQAEWLAPQAAGFGAARRRERLFWRNAPGAGWARSLLAHGAHLTGEFVASLPRWRCLSQVLGRLAACAEFGRYRRHYRQLRAIGAPLFDDLPPTTGGQLRVDAAHTAPTRSAVPTSPRATPAQRAQKSGR